jgi:hypothetical protein
VTTPYALEAGRTYILEASGTIGMWGDGNTDRVDAVWCYNPPSGWDGNSGGTFPRPNEGSWEVLRVDGHGLSEFSAAAGGPSPMPYDQTHVYRVYVQGAGGPVQLSIKDCSGCHHDNSGGITVRISAAQ